MALVDIFIDSRPKVGLLTMDGSLSESHDGAVEWTSNPVENGADLSDHATVMRDEVTIDGIVSRQIDPLRIRDPSFDLDPNRHLKAWNMLQSMKNARKTVTVVTSLHTYTNMGIATLSAPRSLEQSDALFFSVTLREIQFATTNTVSNSLADALADAAGIDDAGTQGTTAANSGTNTAAAGGI